ncbi:MAG TPA: hypothetical protein VE057_01945 [Archangium sp.]|nr:hypothetical protein [Archangium sp.]
MRSFFGASIVAAKDGLFSCYPPGSSAAVVLEPDGNNMEAVFRG